MFALVKIGVQSEVIVEMKCCMSKSSFVDVVWFFCIIIVSDKTVQS